MFRMVFSLRPVNLARQPVDRVLGVDEDPELAGVQTQTLEPELLLKMVATPRAAAHVRAPSNEQHAEVARRCRRGSGGYRHCQRHRAVYPELRGAVRPALVKFHVVGSVGDDDGIADAVG